MIFDLEFFIGCKGKNRGNGQWRINPTLFFGLLLFFLLYFFEQFVVLGQDFNGTDTEHRGEGFIFGFDRVIIQDIVGNHFETGRVIKQLFGINPFYIFFIAVAICDAIAGVFAQVGNLEG